MIDFCEIMIFSSKPEYGNAIDALCGGLFRQSDSGQRFVNGKYRATEEPDLLASHQGTSAGTKTIDVVFSARRASPSAILPQKHLRDLLTACGVVGYVLGL